MEVETLVKMLILACKITSVWITLISIYKMYKGHEIPLDTPELFLYFIMVSAWFV